MLHLSQQYSSSTPNSFNTPTDISQWLHHFNDIHPNNVQATLSRQMNNYKLALLLKHLQTHSTYSVPLSRYPSRLSSWKFSASTIFTATTPTTSPLATKISPTALLLWQSMPLSLWSSRPVNPSTTLKENFSDLTYVHHSFERSSTFGLRRLGHSNIKSFNSEISPRIQPTILREI